MENKPAKPHLLLMLFLLLQASVYATFMMPQVCLIHYSKLLQKGDPL